MAVITIRVLLYVIIAISLLITTAVSYNDGYDQTIVSAFAAGTGLAILSVSDELLDPSGTVETALVTGMMILLIIIVILGGVAVKSR